MQCAQETLTRAGADLVIRDLSELPEVIERGVLVVRHFKLMIKRLSKCYIFWF